MKSCTAVFAAVALSIVLAPPGLAQGMDMKDMDVGKDKKSQPGSHKASGTVTKVDPANGKVSIAHGAVQSLKWPAMTMTFVAGDKALLEKLGSGKKVEFEFVKDGSDYVITSVR